MSASQSSCGCNDTKDADCTVSVLTSAAAGAVTGGSIAGPPGAVAGAVIGAAAGYFSGTCQNSQPCSCPTTKK